MVDSPHPDLMKNSHARLRYSRAPIDWTAWARLIGDGLPDWSSFQNATQTFRTAVREWPLTWTITRVQRRS